LFQNIAADGEVFVGDAVGLEKNPFGVGLRRAVGDDFFRGKVSSLR
jgi:hypothetical protein